MSPRIIFESSKIKHGNMSFQRGNPDEALQNRLNFFKKKKLDYKNCVVMSPTHTTNIKIVTHFDQGKTLDETDGIIANDPSLTIFTLTADCIPLALIDPDKKVFGLIHLSWQNANQDMVTEAINTLIYNFDTTPKNLIANIGPSIGPCCYHQENPQQIKDLKWKPFLKKLPTTYLLPTTNYSINLWSFIENELKKLGLQKSNIENPQICTYHSGKYFSHHKMVKEKLKHDYRLGTLLTIQ